ncbi:MAG: hypothetical protein HKN85_08280, partial [Gammaproteobacteria bacterium]|nr:hypothetical protein [Gammaproteobacteria bacterium]
HNLWLASTYEATSNLWRSMEGMKHGIMTLVTLLISTIFVLGYDRLVSAKSMGSGIHYGFVIGLIVALGFGFGTYGYMPIPMSLAVSWFGGTLVEYLVAGAIVGYFIKQ